MQLTDEMVDYNDWAQDEHNDSQLEVEAEAAAEALSGSFDLDRVEENEVYLDSNEKPNINDDIYVSLRQFVDYDETFGFFTEQTIETMYGIYNHAAKTEDAQYDIQRRTIHDNKTQTDTPYLFISSVVINLKSLQVVCTKCDYNHTLLYNSRQQMEFSTLQVLSHLGTHAPEYRSNYPYSPMSPAYGYTTATQRWISHLDNCKNKECKH